MGNDTTVIPLPAKVGRVLNSPLCLYRSRKYTDTTSLLTMIFYRSRNCTGIIQPAVMFYIGPGSALAQSDDIVGDEELEVGDEEMEVEDEEDEEESVTVPDSSDVSEDVSSVNGLLSLPAIWLCTHPAICVCRMVMC